LTAVHPESPTVQPYTALSELYAEVMAGVPYADWFSYMQPWLAAGPNRIFAELFSGPGEIAAIAAQCGFHAIRLDRLVKTMHNPGVSGICALAESLPFADASVAALAAVNCSIHYLRSPDTLCQHFTEARRVLQTDGVYIFDSCNIARAVWLDGQTFWSQGKNVSFKHSLDADSGILTTRVAIAAGENIARENHVQYIFPDAEISETLQQAGFSLAACLPAYGIPTPENSHPVTTWVALKTGDRFAAK
jgi:ubiquinone/menaquinone biosynthesis C-methylase UbiE